MRFICSNCQQILTSDLYYTKNDLKNPVEIEKEKSGIKNSSFVKIKIDKNTNKHFKRYVKNNSFIINKENIIDKKQLEFISGNGCCGNSSIPFYCPHCNEEVATQYLDCYEDNTLIFINKKISFLYSKIEYIYLLKNKNYNTYWNSYYGWGCINDAELFSNYHIKNKLFNVDVEGLFILKNQKFKK